MQKSKGGRLRCYATDLHLNDKIDLKSVKCTAQGI